ncbi:hypothetical protein VII00023_08004 [Vibrio ichthyoenteri ATCC 700023]|uniref:DUF2986 domain-containing protein n=1 Tax=Vibrio ichthyoenteri ATCC 700023 TaxID=870968 RepID=F9S796_9VIBR|nr:DUF2986 domain-containing protein [Vibrio ichthyoenteri]EGU31983.1 hypothetical protein VII00023_08004 [Vibrio ichthyoenteri ATCC 700023]
MNRKKKINQIYKNRMKKQNAKLHSSNKPRYISKADRAKMEAELAANEVVEDSVTENAAAETADNADATVENAEVETNSAANA